MMQYVIVVVADFAVLLKASSFKSSSCSEDLQPPFILPCKTVMRGLALALLTILYMLLRTTSKAVNVASRSDLRAMQLWY